MPEYAERFDEARLRLTNPTHDPAALRVRFKLKDRSRPRTIQFQADKLYFSWMRDGGVTPDYKSVRPDFDAAFTAVTRFRRGTPAWGEHPAELVGRDVCQSGAPRRVVAGTGGLA